VSGRQAVAGLVAGWALYAALQLAPFNYIVAPLVAGAAAGWGLRSLRGLLAASAGALAGVLGWLSFIAATSARQAIGLAAGIGGSLALGVATLYHLAAPAAATYLAWVLAQPRSKGGGEA
jgi:hypothetical protein